MTALMILTLLLGLIPLRIAPGGGPPEDGMRPEGTRTWKGLCALLILLSHYTGYITAGLADEAYLTFRSGVGQGIVVLFFFYAGYGMMRSGMADARGYLLRRLPRRVLRVWSCGVASVLVMWAVQSLRGRLYDWDVLLDALLFRASLGNNTWFVAVILAEYLMLALGLTLMLRRNTLWTRLACLVMVSMLTALLAWHLYSLWLDDFWYDSVLLFPVGMACALAAWPVGKLLRRCRWLWWTVLLALLAADVLLYDSQLLSFAWREVWYVLLCLTVAALSMRVRSASPVLGFFGDHALAVYLLQRVPMIACYELGWTEAAPYACCVLCAAVTALMALGWDCAMNCVFSRQNIRNVRQNTE